MLEVMQRTFATYITEQPEAVTLKEKLNEAEAALAGARNKMKLGYTDPKTGECRIAGGRHQCEREDGEGWGLLAMLAFLPGQYICATLCEARSAKCTNRLPVRMHNHPYAGARRCPFE